MSELDPGTSGPESRATGKGAGWFTWVKWAFFVVAAGFMTWALADQWDAVKSTIQTAGALSIVISVLAAAVQVALMGEQQRQLLRGWGAHMPFFPWARVFWLSQLGKYLPGTAGAYLAQMELAKERGIRRAVTIVVILLGALLQVSTALLVGGVGLAHQDVIVIPPWLSILAVVISGILLLAIFIRPSIMVGAVNVVGRRIKRLGVIEAPQAEQPLRMAILITLVGWVLFGVHLVALMDVWTPAELVTATSAFALAWVCGFLFLIAPAGAGVREAVLVALLLPVIGDGAALGVALISRFAIIVAEVLLTVLAVLMGLVVRSRGRTDPVLLERARP